MIKAQLDAKQVTQQYGAALRRLASLTGFDQKAVLLGEAGIILKTAAGRTKMPTDKKSDLRSRLHTLRDQALTTAYEKGDITINAGLKGQEGRVWRKVGKGKKFLLVAQVAPGGRGADFGIAAAGRGRNSGASRWASVPSVSNRVNRYVNKLPSSIQKGRRAAGLAAKSWLQIADALNIDLAAVQGGGTISGGNLQKAREAVATSGKPHQNGVGSSTGDAAKTEITLTNRLPYGAAIGFDRMLLSIMAGRAKYFQKSYENGAFDTMQRAARAYPWLRVKRVG